jgi:hypothetical protein
LMAMGSLLRPVAVKLRRCSLVTWKW